MAMLRPSALDRAGMRSIRRWSKGVRVGPLSACGWRHHAKKRLESRIAEGAFVAWFAEGNRGEPMEKDLLEFVLAEVG